MPNNQISVKSLKITTFRKFHDDCVNFEKSVTLITGQNGTAKSTLLGMLAQPFSFGSEKEREKEDKSAYIGNYHGEKLADYKDIAGNFYTYQCDKIFRLSKKHDTPDKEYLYETILNGIDFKVDSGSPLKTKKLLTVQQTRGGKLRFVTGPALKDSRSVSHNSGEGNFPHPVIYLSLGRLLPLAEVKACEFTETKDVLSSEEEKWYSDSYKAIFAVVDEAPKSGLMETKEKKTSIVPFASDYDGESCSAGQDNIGRILTAILSFKRLKVKLGEKYRGGLLLIDEIDSTLHPSSQIRLIELIKNESENLSLQVVVTTHSLYLIRHCTTVLRKYVGLIHISKNGNELEVNSNATYKEIEADLKNISIPPSPPQKRQKVSILLEDAEAVRLFKYLTKQEKSLRGLLSIANVKLGKKKGDITHLSGQYLEIFANNADKVPELKNLVIIPDGDMPWVNGCKNPNVLSLPGNKPIEKQIFEMLKSLSATDPFWGDCNGINYKKNVVFGNCTSLESTDLSGVKRWYQSQKQYWGKELGIVFDKYYRENKTICDAFLSKLKKIINRITQ